MESEKHNIEMGDVNGAITSNIQPTFNDDGVFRVPPVFQLQETRSAKAKPQLGRDDLEHRAITANWTKWIHNKREVEKRQNHRRAMGLPALGRPKPVIPQKLGTSPNIDVRWCPTNLL